MRILLLLYRDDYYDRAGEEEEDGTPNNTVEVIIEKSRSGARVDSRIHNILRI